MADILVVSAHPDDETLFAGGSIARCVEEGHHVYILETTRGEGGELGDPPLATRSNLGEVREAEMRRAAEALGARDIFFLSFIDPYMEIGGTARAIEVPLEEFSAAIAIYIERLNPDLVITHGSRGEYGHPQHIYAHQATLLALRRTSPEVPMLSWSAWYGSAERERILNPDDPADLVIDVRPWIDAKIEAALCHRTQHAMFLRNSGASSVQEMVWATESFRIWNNGPGSRRHLEAFSMTAEGLV